MSDSIGSNKQAGLSRLAAASIAPKQEPVRPKGEKPTGILNQPQKVQLEEAVKFNREATGDLNKLSGDPDAINAVNREATEQASLRNFKEASDLAEKLSSSIRKNPQAAITAQDPDVRKSRELLE